VNGGCLSFLKDFLPPEQLLVMHEQIKLCHMGFLVVCGCSLGIAAGSMLGGHDAIQWCNLLSVDVNEAGLTLVFFSFIRYYLIYSLLLLRCTDNASQAWPLELANNLARH
jgi:hypothetical protein